MGWTRFVAVDAFASARIAPETAAEVWAWPLTPLTSRMLGAWFIWGLFEVMLALDARWSSARVILQAMMLGLVLMLISVAQAWSELDTGRPFTYAFLATSFLALGYLGPLYLGTESRIGDAVRGAPAPALGSR